MSTIYEAVTKIQFGHTQWARHGDSSFTICLEYEAIGLLRRCTTTNKVTPYVPSLQDLRATDWYEAVGPKVFKMVPCSIEDATHELNREGIICRSGHLLRGTGPFYKQVDAT